MLHVLKITYCIVLSLIFITFLGFQTLLEIDFLQIVYFWNFFQKIWKILSLHISVIF